MQSQLKSIFVRCHSKKKPVCKGNENGELDAKLSPDSEPEMAKPGGATMNWWQLASSVRLYKLASRPTAITHTYTQLPSWLRHNIKSREAPPTRQHVIMITFNSGNNININNNNNNNNIELRVAMETERQWRWLRAWSEGGHLIVGLSTSLQSAAGKHLWCLRLPSQAERNAGKNI